MRYRFVAPVLATAIALAGNIPSSSAAETKPTIGLPDCVGTPHVAPSTLLLTCADAGITVSKLRWTGWGGSFTAGLGTAAVNDCTPDCASGHDHSFDVVLIADGRARCPNGEPAYARVTFGWFGRAPIKTDETTTVFPTPCGPRADPSRARPRA